MHCQIVYFSVYFMIMNQSILNVKKAEMRDYSNASITVNYSSGL